MSEKKYSYDDADIYTIDNLHEEDKLAVRTMLELRDECRKEWVEEYIREYHPYSGTVFINLIREILTSFSEFSAERIFVKSCEYTADKIDSYPAEKADICSVR